MKAIEKELFCLEKFDGSFSSPASLDEIKQFVEKTGIGGKIYFAPLHLVGEAKPVIEFSDEIKGFSWEAEGSPKAEAPAADSPVPKKTRRPKRAVKANKGKRSSGLPPLNGTDRPH